MNNRLRRLQASFMLGIHDGLEKFKDSLSFKPLLKKSLVLGTLAITLMGYSPTFTYMLVGSELAYRSQFSKTVYADEDTDDSSPKDDKLDEIESDETESNENGSKLEQGSTTSSNGTAMSRVATFISFAAGKTANAESLAQLTQKDLQFLGIFMSNYYTPWITDLGSSSDTASDSIQGAFTEVLSSELGFDSELSSTFAKNLTGLLRSNTTTQLTWKFDSKPNASNPANSGSKEGATYADLLMITVPHFTDQNNAATTRYVYNRREYLKDKLGVETATEGVKGTKEEYRYAYLMNGSNIVGVYDTWGEDITASTLALQLAHGLVDPSKGYGHFLFDFKASDLDGMSDEEIAQKLSGQLQDNSTLNVKLGLSPFGDLLWLGKNHQYVVVPGVMNPFLYQAVGSDGKDVKNTRGQYYNLSNLQTLVHIKKDNFSSITFSEGEGSYSMSYPLNYLNYNRDSLGDATTQDTEKIGGYSLARIWGTGNTSNAGLSDAQMKALAGTYKTGEEQNTEDYQNKWRHPLMYLEQSNFFLPYFGSVSDAKSNIKVLDKVTLFDNLGSYGWVSDIGNSSEDSYGSAGDEEVYSAAKFESIIEGDKVHSGLVDGSNLEEPIQWGNSMNAEEKSLHPSNIGGSAPLGVFYSLAVAVGDHKDGTNKSQTALGWRLDTSWLPELSNDPLFLDGELTGDGNGNDLITKDIRDKIYYWLHPSDGFLYKLKWIDNFIKNFLLSVNDSILGTEGVGVLPGTTRYTGFSGYVTTPEMTDISWTDSMLSWYKSVQIYLIVLFMFIMLCNYVVGFLTLQKAILGFIILALSINVPVLAVNWSANLSNGVSNWLYSDKFMHWGVVQQEAYFAELADSIDATNNTYRNYLFDLYKKNAEENPTMGGNNIMLRWQAPKKMRSLVLTDEDEQEIGETLSNLIKFGLNKKYSGEEFTENVASTYFFRQYTDIANVSMFMYGNSVSNGIARDGVKTYASSADLARWTEELVTAYKNFDTNYKEDRNNGYTLPDGGGSTDGMEAYRVKLALASTMYADAAQQNNISKIDSLGLREYLGIDQRAFNFSIAYLNTNSNIIAHLEGQDGFDPSMGSKYTDEDYKALASYGVMSENVFYYYSWLLYDMGLASNPNIKGGFRELLLGRENAGFFYNTQGNNELRDYLDMRSLFTYVIPYLKMGNDVVRAWDEKYGVFFHEGVTYEEGHENDSDIKDNPELAQKYWHNVNVARLYNIYTPWVDLMYDAEYAKPTKIRYQGTSYEVKNPLDPASYPEERPMIFSKSEMFDYGLKESQLTEVERKIIKVQENVIDKWFQLLNYYTFTDVSLNTSAAMEAAFEFNSTFSQSAGLGKDAITIYPQSFELKNFTYDAFLRLIISSSADEDIFSTEGGSIYQKIMKKSSVLTALGLVILSIIANWLLPFVKITAMIMMFISSVFFLIVTAVSSREDVGKSTVKKVFSSAFGPALRYFLTSALLAFVVSLFMSSGATGVTGIGEGVVTIKDPVMTILALAVINSIAMYYYLRILWDLFLSIKESGSIVKNVVAGSVLGAASTAISSAGNTKAGNTVKSIAKTLGITALGAAAVSSMGVIGSAAAAYGGAKAIQVGSKAVSKRRRKAERKATRRMMRKERAEEKREKAKSKREKAEAKKKEKENKRLSKEAEKQG